MRWRPNAIRRVAGSDSLLHERVGSRIMTSRVPRLLTVLGVTLALTAAHVGADARPRRTRSSASVLHWNAIAAQAFLPTQGTDPLGQSRTFSILHAAIHDAINAIDPRYELYTEGLSGDSRASLPAAVAAASREVLRALVPTQQALIEEAYIRALADIAGGSAKAEGISIGEAAARATLARRQFDGADTATQPVYVPTGVPGDYQFTAPFTFANLPGWGRVTPFVIDPQQHELRGQDSLASLLYAADFNYVKAVGRIDSQTRTPEQSQIAQFWYEDSPLGWNRIAATAIQRERLDAHEAARAFALVHFAMADGFIAGFEAKYRFRFWRPVTAIQQAATDGNDLTQPDAAWQPFLTTPPVPDYPSTHTVLGAAAAEVLVQLFGDKMRFSATSVTLPGVTRQFKGFSQAAIENGLSRVYAGIHFGRAVFDGYHLGRSIGRDAAKRLPALAR
jgi:membrane-associated phospholipid phosphatase